MKKRNQYLKITLSIVLTILASLLLAMKMKYDQTGKAFVPETALVTGTILMMAAIMVLVARYFIKKGETIPYNKAVKGHTCNYRILYHCLSVRLLLCFLRSVYLVYP